MVKVVRLLPNGPGWEEKDVSFGEWERLKASSIPAPVPVNDLGLDIALHIEKNPSGKTGNQCATYLMITRPSGFAAPQYQTLGPAIALSQSGHDYGYDDHLCMHEYLCHVLDYYGEDGGPPEALFTPLGFQKFLRNSIHQCRLNEMPVRPAHLLFPRCKIIHDEERPHLNGKQGWRKYWESGDKTMSVGPPPSGEEPGGGEQGQHTVYLDSGEEVVVKPKNIQVYPRCRLYGLKKTSYLNGTEGFRGECVEGRHEVFLDDGCNVRAKAENIHLI